MTPNNETVSVDARGTRRFVVVTRCEWNLTSHVKKWKTERNDTGILVCLLELCGFVLLISGFQQLQQYSNCGC